MEYKGRKIAYPLSKIDLEYLYCDEKLSGEKIAKLLNLDSGTVSYYRKKYDIKLVEAWERKGLPDQFSCQEKEVILGYLLGDGHLGLNSNYAHLRVSQSLEQKDFVHQIYNYLQRWASYFPVTDKHFDRRYQKIYYAYRFDTVANPLFQQLYDLCYKKRVKTLSTNWLDNIDGLGLALWYEGDGTLDHPTLPIMKSNNFSFDEHDLLMFWFKTRFEIETYCRKTSTGYNICIKDALKFRKIIDPYIITHFVYKLPRNKHRSGRKSKNGLLQNS